MPGFIVHLGSTVQCSHAGQAQPTAVNPRVTVSGHPIVTMANQYVVSACSLASTSAPPCVTASWTTSATRVFAGGQSVVIIGSQSTCQPTGQALLILSTQTRVTAT